MTVTQRNALVEQYLWCIDSVIWQNHSLIVGAHLDREDVYQSLAVRLMLAIEWYNTSKGRNIKDYILDELKHELISCGSAQARYGFRDAPYYLRNSVVSLESLEEDVPWGEDLVAA